MEQDPRDLTNTPDVKLPRAAAMLAETHPELWQTFQRLGELAGDAGPRRGRERRLIHL